MINLATAALLLFAPASARADDDAKKVLESFQGKWKTVEWVKKGKASEERVGEKVVIAGSMLSVFDKEGRRTDEATFTIDTKTTPNSIDIIDGPNGDKAKKDRIVKGIYKLEKDKLIICFALDAGERPKEFKSTKDNGTAMFSFERAKQ